MKLQMQWVKSFSTKLVLNIATLGSLGYIKKAPGTIGSAVGILYYTVFFYKQDFLGYLLLLLFSIYLAIAFCGEAEVRLKQKDAQVIILDELVAMPVCFLGMKPLFHKHPVWLIMLLGFFLFRFFDIVKPLYISRLQKLNGGFGVVMDDVAAALATNISLWLILGFLF